MTVDAVLFDIDGTLVDSNEAHVDAWVAAFREAGFPLSAAAVRPQIGQGGDILVPKLLPDADDAVREEAAERHGAIFKARHLGGVRPFPDAAALLRRVHASGRKVVLASSARREELDHYVALLDIADILAAASSADDADTSKPAPDIFAVALDKVGVAAADAIAVGDTIYDVEAAGKLGLRAVGLTSGPFDAAALEAAGAVAVYADVADLHARFDGSPLGGRSLSGRAR